MDAKTEHNEKDGGCGNRCQFKTGKHLNNNDKCVHKSDNARIGVLAASEKAQHRAGDAIFQNDENCVRDSHMRWLLCANGLMVSMQILRNTRAKYKPVHAFFDISSDSDVCNRQIVGRGDKQQGGQGGPSQIVTGLQKYPVASSHRTPRGDSMGRYDNRAAGGLFNYAPETVENGALAPYKVGSEVTKVVRVLNLLYLNKATGFAVYQVEEDERILVIRGFFPTAIQMNGYYEVSGKVTERDGEKQIDVSRYHSAMPADREGIINVLKTLHGLDTKAYKLYSICGQSILEQIRSDPDSVAEKMKGLGFSKKMVLLWQQQLLSAGAEEEALRILLGFGIKPKKAKTLLDEFGPDVAEKIQKNPYLLLSHIDGLTFAECDRLALQNGYSLDGLDRIQEAVKNALRFITEDVGSTCARKAAFVNSCRMAAGYPIGALEAKSILRQASESGCQDVMVYMLGSNRIEVDVRDLRQKLDAWQNSTKNSRFRYPLYRCSNELLSLAVHSLLTAGSIVRNRAGGESYYSLAPYALYERQIAEKVRHIAAAEDRVFSSEEVMRTTGFVLMKRSREKGEELVLEQDQALAVSTCCSSKGGVFILTGPAGSGKTFVLGVIIEVLRNLYQARGEPFSVQLLAPTGKAAKVAERSAGLPASTIHRFIGNLSSGTVLPLADLFVIDESSMVDEELMAGVLREMPSASKVVIIGDTEQLPSIGAGSCLRDMIRSGCIPHAALTVVKRQAEHSGILINANRIIRGEMIQSERPNAYGAENNTYVVLEEDPVIAREKIVALVRKAGLRRLQNEEVQVLCPKKKGETGTYAVNFVLQMVLNPYLEGEDGQGKQYDRISTAIEAEYTDVNGERHKERLYFQVRDRVMHIRNNYERNWYAKGEQGDFHVTGRQGVMNGETGVIERIYQAQTASGVVRRAVVRYGTEYVFYDGDDVDELQHAYAITIHKAQGSQWPIVLCPVMGSDYIMLNRQLLYTMYPRASETLYLTGSRQAIWNGIKNAAPQNRLTLLSEMIREQCEAQKACLPPAKL